MQLCDKTITVFNARFNPEMDKDEYLGTVISGVSWFCAIESTVDDGLKAANKFTVRVPVDADFSGKVYAPPKIFQKVENTSDFFTLQNGDMVVLGAAPTDGMTPTVLKKDYESFVILGVTDSSKSPRGAHWKVVGA